MPSARPKSAKSLRKCGTQKQETTTSTTPDEDIDYHITFPTNFNTDFIEHELITDFVKGSQCLLIYIIIVTIIVLSIFSILHYYTRNTYDNYIVIIIIIITLYNL